MKYEVIVVKKIWHWDLKYLLDNKKLFLGAMVKRF